MVFRFVTFCSGAASISSEVPLSRRGGQELEELLEALLKLARNTHADTAGNHTMDLTQLNLLLKDGSDKVLRYSKYSRIAQGMLRGEAQKKPKKDKEKKDGDDPSAAVAAD